MTLPIKFQTFSRYIATFFLTTDIKRELDCGSLYITKGDLTLTSLREFKEDDHARQTVEKMRIK